MKQRVGRNSFEKGERERVRDFEKNNRFQKERHNEKRKKRRVKNSATT